MPELIGGLHRALTARLVADLKKSGFDDVTPAFSAILPLIREGGTRQSEMARRAGMTKQAVGQLVKELSARGYVELGPDPSDPRARLVRFTPRGLALRDCGFRLKRDARQALARLLPEGELDQLAEALRRLLAGIGTAAPGGGEESGS